MFTNRTCLITGAAMLLVGWPLRSQNPPAPARSIQPDDVVATVEGEKITPRRIQQLRESLPPQFRQAAGRMNDKAFLTSYAQLVVLSRLAEKQKIIEHEPLKAQWEFVRMNFLAQSYLDYLNKQSKPGQDDFQKYYNEHKSEFDEAMVRAIYIAFSAKAAPAPAGDPNAKKPLTEEQAKSKAEALAAQLKQGADFAKLAKENSDDKASAEKGGDIGAIQRGPSGIPVELKNAIFALKPGEITGPVRQPAGYYIFKVDGFRTIPFEEAAVKIAPTVQGLKVKEELDRIMKSIQITYDNESYFANPGGPPTVAPNTPVSIDIQRPQPPKK